MKKILFLGLFSFLLAALWQLPLSYAKSYAEDMVNGLKLKDVSGTVWQGKAQHFTVQNTYLGKVKWRIKPIDSLFSLSLKTSFNIESKDLTATGIAAIRTNKKLILDNTQFDLNAKYLNNFQQNAKIFGDIKGNIKHAEIEKRKVPHISGTIDWKSGAIDSTALKLEPGDYHAVISPEAGDLNIILSSSDAPVELSGDIILNKEWIYDTNLKTKSDNQTVAAVLSFIGKRQADGYTLIKKSGDLKPFINK